MPIWSLAIVAVIAFWVGHDKAAEDCAADKLATKLAAEREIARQERAARDIAAAATARVEDDLTTEKQLREIIDQERRHVPLPPRRPNDAGLHDCSIDDRFSGVVRKLDAAGGKVASPRAAR